MLGILGKTEDLIAFLNKKKIGLSVFFFILLGLSYSKPASAGTFSDLADWISTRPIFFLIKMTAEVGNYFVGLAGDLLNWVLSPSFISFPYTRPGTIESGGNPIIKAGLGITQGFVNMILVLVLVYIAIATILRLSDYNTRKLLITFFIIALLVNFAPVFCGLIVDTSNIIMNFFVKDLNSNIFQVEISSKIQIISGQFEKAAGWDQAKQYILQVLAMLPVLFGLFFILLLFTLLFILRYVVIWLLVILSPLAFAAYILPNTKHYFDDWLKQLLSWSFIGVTCGFFLYLALLLMSSTREAITLGKMAIPATAGQSSGMLDGILPFAVSIVFLGLGFVVGLKTSAMGASTAMSTGKAWAKRGVKKGAKWTRQGAWAGTKAGGRKVGRMTKEAMAKSDAMQGWAQRRSAARRLGEGETGIAGFAKRTLGRATGNWLYRTKRGLGKVAGSELAEGQADRIKNKRESLKGKNANTLLQEYHKSATIGNQAEQIGVINAAINSGQIDDLMDTKKYGINALRAEEIQKLYKVAKVSGSHKMLEKAVPHIIHKDDPEAMKEVISKMKVSDCENISESVFKNASAGDTAAIAAVDAILEKSMGSHVSKFIEKHGKYAVEAIEQRIDAGSYVNPHITKYLSGNAGAGLISPNRKVEDWNRKKPETANPITAEQKVKEEREALRRMSKPQNIWEVYKKSKAQKEARRDALNKRKRREEERLRREEEKRKEKKT